MAKYQSNTAKCIITGQTPVDLHHVRTRAANGSDEPYNLMPLIHPMHQMVHQIGLKRFSEEFPEVRAWLIKHGWELCPITFKWRRL
jgi:hypothetical protein